MKIELKNNKMFINGIEVDIITLKNGLKLKFPFENIESLNVSGGKNIINGNISNVNSFILGDEHD